MQEISKNSVLFLLLLLAGCLSGGESKGFFYAGGTLSAYIFLIASYIYRDGGKLGLRQTDTRIGLNQAFILLLDWLYIGNDEEKCLSPSSSSCHVLTE